MTDADLIQRLGGPRAVCSLLGYDADRGGLQRVYNWLRRGNIPYKVKVNHAAVWDLARNAPRRQLKPPPKTTPKTPRRASALAT